MRIQIATVVLLSVLCGSARAEEAPIRLTLKDAVITAVEKNLDVRAELYNPAVAEADIRKNRGIYDTRLSLLTDYRDSTTLPASTFLTGALTSRQKTLKFNAGANRLIPTGATLGAAFNNSWIRTNSTITLNDYYQSDLTLTLSQPLLKNFGREATELNISVAALGKEGTLERFKTRLIDTVARVRTEYFNLYSLTEDLEVKMTSLALAQKILADTSGRVKAGVLPAMEILNAEFGVASREKELIDAERALRDQMDVLRVLLQLEKGRDIAPLDAPSKDVYEVTAEEAVSRALAGRPELKELAASIKTVELQARVARNQTLPDLKLNASAALTGLAKDYNRDLERIGSGDFPVWQVGLQLDYPIGNSAAENDYIRNRLKVEQSRTQLRSLEENISNEAKAAVRGIVSSYKQLEVADRGRAFAEERLKAFIKKNEVGLATIRDVLDVETELANAKSNRIKAGVNYDAAITQLWKATGEILEREGVRVSEKEADALYEMSR